MCIRIIPTLNAVVCKDPAKGRDILQPAMSALDLFTRLSGWLLVVALAGAIAVARRRRPMLAHYVLGWLLAAVGWFHLYYPMAGGLVGRTPTWGLWVAVVAWALLLAQLGVGNRLRMRAGRAGPLIRGSHRLAMRGVVAATIVHVVVNSISLRALSDGGAAALPQQATFAVAPARVVMRPDPE